MEIFRFLDRKFHFIMIYNAINSVDFLKAPCVFSQMQTLAISPTSTKSMIQSCMVQRLFLPKILPWNIDFNKLTFVSNLFSIHWILNDFKLLKITLNSKSESIGFARKTVVPGFLETPLFSKLMINLLNRYPSRNINPFNRWRFGPPSGQNKVLHSQNLFIDRKIQTRFYVS